MDDSGHVYDLPGLARSLAAVLAAMGVASDPADAGTASAGDSGTASASDTGTASASDTGTVTSTGTASVSGTVAASAAGASPAEVVVELSFPPRPELGDVATNAAMVSARRMRRNPREIAAELGERWLAGEGGAVCDRTEVAGPGFLNLHLGDGWYRGAVDLILQRGEGYGRDVLYQAERKRVNIEFVSVNPTGPLHVGHARYASMGDALCRIFTFAGHDVTREFYVNDHGTQMLRFGWSLAARYAQELGLDMPLPEDAYEGDYVVESAKELRAEWGDRHREALAAVAPDITALDDETTQAFKWWGCESILTQFRGTLERLRVPFDVWASEASLFEGGDSEWRGYRGEVGKALTQMDDEGHLYEADGAVWLRTTEYGDDKDRVLIRQTGVHTYFLSDIAYHRDKMDRGFEHMIDIWGADHHGYVPRMKAAFTALPPHEPDRLELLIGQMVNLTESGETKRMSKRKGDIVTVDDLMDAIGVDATRFFMVSRSHDSTLDLDLDLAVEQSGKNPVYYVQYAHARICSILRRIEAEGRPVSGLASENFASAGLDTFERALVRALVRFPLVVREAVDGRAPHRIAAYLGELSAEFHVFYRNCRVLVDDDATASLRTGLCLATRSILATGLDLLGVEAPDRM